MPNGDPWNISVKRLSGDEAWIKEHQLLARVIERAHAGIALGPDSGGKPLAVNAAVVVP